MLTWLRRHPALPLGLLVTVLVLVGFGPAIGLLIGFVVLTPLERLFRRHDQPVRRPGVRTDVLHFLFTGLLNNVATIAAFVVVYVLLNRLANPVTTAWLAEQHALVQFGLALVIFELVNYWYHRLSHELPFLWRFHSVHHSSEQLDWLAAARLHPLEGFFAGLLIAPPLVLLGFQAVTVPAVTVLLTTWAILLHANVRWRLGPLDGLLGTPEYHHWHHSNELQARNRNYSGLLPMLDRIFGTYYLPTHRRPEIYGIDDAMPAGWWSQLRQPFRRRRRSVVPF